MWRGEVKTPWYQNTKPPFSTTSRRIKPKHPKVSLVYEELYSMHLEWYQLRAIVDSTEESHTNHLLLNPSLKKLRYRVGIKLHIPLTFPEGAPLGTCPPGAPPSRLILSHKAEDVTQLELLLSTKGASIHLDQRPPAAWAGCLQGRNKESGREFPGSPTARGLCSHYRECGCAAQPKKKKRVSIKKLS